ncbi:hypothetical protein [Rossellomorea marisflavi]|uniref:hypothetical protein n=1 Tax=Rossellomorea marisflavi TaxID=189381 RepID=UPI003F9FEDE5
MKTKPAQVASAKEKSGWGWIWWVLFPPYAMYRFIRYNSMKWYFKTPIVFILTLVIILSVDLALYPNRVEEAQAEKAITTYLADANPSESFRKVERVGRGYSVKGKDVQEVVYYRAISGISLFELGLNTNDGQELTVSHGEQLYPIRIEEKDMDKRTEAEVAVWLYKHKDEVGKPKELISNDQESLTQVVKTEKGVYEFKVGNQSVYEVNRIDKKKNVLKRDNAPILPSEVTDYLKKNKEKVGTLKKVLAYELDAVGEKYYFRTSNGDYLTVSEDNGHIELKKRNESKE